MNGEKSSQEHSKSVAQSRSKRIASSQLTSEECPSLFERAGTFDISAYCSCEGTSKPSLCELCPGGEIVNPEDESIYDIVKVPKKDRKKAGWGISGGEGEIVYHVTLHVQECNAIDLIVYDDRNKDRGDYFDLSGKSLEVA